MSIATNLKRRLRLPVIGSPLFIISTPDLVIAQCKAGIVGSFPALNARPAPVLDEWLKRITSELKEHDARHPERPAAPFAVNQIVHRSNDRLDHALARPPTDVIQAELAVAGKGCERPSKPARRSVQWSTGRKL